jgi:hypothetical protein
MELIITDEKTLGQIKGEFSLMFPHLKLEFYGISHNEGEGTSESFILENSMKLSEARKKHNEGHLNISANNKTNTLEIRFKEHYGLNVQVFRKSGNLWMQTTATDEWTLLHQEETALAHDKHWDLEEKEFPDLT